MDNELTFGSFIRAKRLEHKFTLRVLAELLQMSLVHMSNIENGRRTAPKLETLKKMISELNLSKEETELMYDLAANSKSITSVAGDLPKYIEANDIVKVALRTARDADATDEEWKDFIERINKRIINKGEPPFGRENANEP